MASRSASAGPAARRGVDEFTAVRHVYEPHKVGLPKLGPYLREVWRRRSFAWEMARTDLRSAHYGTVFGQAWLVINPLMLGLVYFMLVSLIRGGNGGIDYFAHLIAGLFAFYFVSGAMTAGSRSVTGGGRLIMNQAFPRVLLPLASVTVALLRFIPTLVVYAVIHLVAGRPGGWHLLLVVPILLELLLFAAAIAMFFATLQVYFRDTTSFLPYFNRIWLYLSPVLWIPDNVSDLARDLSSVNPLYWLIGALGEVLDGHGSPSNELPSVAFMLGGLAWSVGALVLAFLFFVSREREFAVRL